MSHILLCRISRCGVVLTVTEKKADPGIPNTFPYKDKVLAELAEEKRQVSVERSSELGPNADGLDGRS